MLEKGEFDLKEKKYYSRFHFKEEKRAKAKMEEKAQKEASKKKEK